MNFSTTYTEVIILLGNFCSNKKNITRFEASHCLNYVKKAIKACSSKQVKELLIEYKKILEEIK